MALESRRNEHPSTRQQSNETDASETDRSRETPQKEVGGRDGPDPVRYGDWEKKGRCIDF
jgi:hypothetical protein